MRAWLWLALVSALAAGPAQAATFVVTSTGDEADVSPDGICTIGPPTNACTLRAAIEEANRAPVTADVIRFNIPGPGPYTITFTSGLPSITQPVTIDGTSQLGFTGTPIIELNAASAGATHALNLFGAGSSGSTIRGLVINRSPGTAINILNSSNNVVAGNYLGTDVTGALARGSSVGVYISGGTNNQIGGTTVADRNVISGNTVDGIQIDGTGATNNLVRGNYIGLNAAGTAALANANQGVAIFNGSANNTIGGTAPGAGNVISGNGNGIAINSAGTTGNLVQGNLIGTDRTGTVAIGNALRGVSFDTGAANNTVGGTAAGAGNTIAYNTQTGVWLGSTAGAGNGVLGNAIFANGALGIDLNGNGFPELNDTGDGDTGANNLQNHPVLSAAMTNGVSSANLAGSLNGAASTTYRVEFFASSVVDLTGYGEGQRYLGSTNITTNATGNATIGVTLATSLSAGEYVTATATDPSNNTSEFGGALVAVGHLLVTTTADTMDGITTSVVNLIAGPGPDGRISLREAIQATNATAGVDPIGFGIPLTDANHVYYQDDGIGGSFSAPTTTTLADLSTPSSPTITNYDADYPAGQARSWYRIQPTSALPTITGALTLDATTQPLSVVGRGPVIELNAASAGATRALDLGAGSSGSTIRGLVVNRSPGTAINILVGSSNNVIVGNYLGTDLSGTLPRGNAVGVFIQAGNNRIGGTTFAERNVVSGNAVDGIQIAGTSATNNLVQGNYIGLDATGTAGIGNTGTGVAIYGGAVNSAVGGTVAGAGNVISGNNIGIAVSNPGTVGSRIEGNSIGTNAAGTAGIANVRGIFIGASGAGSTVGGPAAGASNRIAFNSTSAVAVVATAGTGNAIMANTVYSNGALGIDLGDNGVTANDALDGDTGPNDLLNFPLITSVLESGGVLTVNFQLDVPAGSYRVEFFKNPSGADPSGNGEGEVYASSMSLIHPGGGALVFNHSFAGNLGDVITATTTACTDGAACAAFGGTSEFGAAIVATLAPVDLTLTKSDAPDPADLGGLLTYTLGVANAGASQATGVILTDTLPADMTFEAATPSQGTCGFVTATRKLTCNLGAINPSAGATVVLQVRPWAVGKFTNTASVIANEDPGPNTATQQTTVLIPAPGLPFFTVTSTSGRNVVEFLNPAGSCDTNTVVMGKPGGFPTGPGDAVASTLVCVPDPDDTRKCSCTHSGLTDGTTYYYAGFAQSGAAPGRFNTGRPPHPTNEPAVKWAFSTGAFGVTAPTVTQHGVIATCNDRVVYAMQRGAADSTPANPTGGRWPTGAMPSEDWRPVQLGGVVQSRSPFVPTGAVVEDSMYLGAQDGKAYAVNAKTGTLRSGWTYPQVGNMVQAAPAGIFAAYGGTFDYILVGTRDDGADNAFSALDPGSGAVIESYDNGGGTNGIGIISGMAAVDYEKKRVYFASHRSTTGGSTKTLWCLQLASTTPGPVFTLEWARDLGDIDGSPVLRNARVYVGSALNGGTVYSLDASNGGDDRTYVHGDGQVKGFLFPDRNSPTGDVYFATSNFVWGVSDFGGTLSLKFPAVSLGGSVKPSPVLLVPGTSYLYIGGTDGKLYEIDVASGLVISSMTLGDGLATVGAPSLDRGYDPNLIHVGTGAGVFYAVEVPLP